MSAIAEPGMKQGTVAKSRGAGFFVLAGLIVVVHLAALAVLVATEYGPNVLEQGLLLATPLAPVIGYDKTAYLVKRALATGKTIRQLAYDESGLPKDEVDRLLNPAAMTEPGAPTSASGG